MRTINQWFSEYEVSHQNPQNKLIHYFCVPLITYSTLGILDALSQAPYFNLPFSLALPFVILGSLFYLRLNWILGLVLFFMTYAMILSFSFFPSSTFLLYFQIGLFIVSWFFQFLGHKLEAAKPSFLEDLTFLLIGPLWVVNKALGVVKK